MRHRSSATSEYFSLLDGALRVAENGERLAALSMGHRRERPERS